MPSTSIRHSSCDATTRTLSIWLVTNGKRYDYQDVPPETYGAFRSAFSKGYFFNSNIRRHFAFRQNKDSALPNAPSAGD
ncbi:KTSC domain-containing protein (plasmid) [Devosia neptuniae]|uniref:KTSC domain-containing protein n=1 Tax=Devosia neptuniae TaxID=191302 RepID=A0ABY6C710_9HYPH|nr:KTSC domain-containing protein [Devosia neptuniae]UXN68034.1 KTSC domain-containing protein [Devosia neptuniae]